MVLGIDEYWIGDEQNEKTNFTIFKKFLQRIQEHTGNESYRYLGEMQKLFKEKRGGPVTSIYQENIWMEFHMFMFLDILLMLQIKIFYQVFLVMIRHR